MSYTQERGAIEAYFLAQWADATPVFQDGFEADPVAPSVMLKVKSGAVMQGSIGCASNRIDHTGMLQVFVFVEGGKGSEKWRPYATTITDFLRNTTIDNAGAVITSPSDAFVRFSPRGNMHPYLANVSDEPPFTLATINAPFVRYERD